MTTLLMIIGFGAATSVVVGRKRREEDPDAAPLSVRDATLMTWGGMRGLATVALALSIPATTSAGAPFPGRSYIVVAAAVALLVTLVLAGLSFPKVVAVLGIDDEAEKEHQATRDIALRAYKAAMREIKNDDTLPDDVIEPLRARFKVLHDQLSGTTDDQASSEQAMAFKEHREQMMQVQKKAMQSARAAVLKARRERGTDPEIADRVLHRFDLQSVITRQGRVGPDRTGFRAGPGGAGAHIRAGYFDEDSSGNSKLSGIDSTLSMLFLVRVQISPES